MAMEVWQCRSTTQLSAIPSGLYIGHNYLDQVYIANGVYQDSSIITSSGNTYVLFGARDAYWASNGYYGTRRVIMVNGAVGSVASLLASYATKVTPTTEDIIAVMKAHLKTAYSHLSYKNATMPTNKNVENLASTVDTILTRKTEQTKSTTITSNGTTTVTPDSGKVLSSVSITTNVSPKLQTKTVTPSASTQTVTPDSSYDGLSKVTVNAIPSDYAALVDVPTAEEMNAKLVAANVGKAYRFTGTTDDTYTNGDIYEVVQQSGGGSDVTPSDGYTVTLVLADNQYTAYDIFGYSVNNSGVEILGVGHETPFVINNVTTIQFSRIFPGTFDPEPGQLMQIGTTPNGSEIGILKDKNSTSEISITADITYYISIGGITPSVGYLVSYTNKAQSSAPASFKINGEDWQTITDASGTYLDVATIQFTLGRDESFACTVKSTTLGIDLSANDATLSEVYTLTEPVEDIVIGWGPRKAVIEL